jgi:hypothetical protein
MAHSGIVGIGTSFMHDDGRWRQLLNKWGEESEFL